MCPVDGALNGFFEGFSPNQLSALALESLSAKCCNFADWIDQISAKFVEKGDELTIHPIRLAGN